VQPEIPRAASPEPQPAVAEEISKRDKRRKKQARKKAESVTVDQSTGFTPAKRKAKVEVAVTNENIEAVAAGIREKQAKLSDKWSAQWPGGFR
jgi:hypothetical protein